MRKGAVLWKAFGSWVKFKVGQSLVRRLPRLDSAACIVTVSLTALEESEGQQGLPEVEEQPPHRAVDFDRAVS